MYIMYHTNARCTTADRHPALLLMKGKQEMRRTFHWLRTKNRCQESSAPLHPTPPLASISGEA